MCTCLVHLTAGEVCFWEKASTSGPSHPGRWRINLNLMAFSNCHQCASPFLSQIPAASGLWWSSSLHKSTSYLPKSSLLRPICFFAARHQVASCLWRQFSFYTTCANLSVRVYVCNYCPHHCHKHHHHHHHWKCHHILLIRSDLTIFNFFPPDNI